MKKSNEVVLPKRNINVFTLFTEVPVYSEDNKKCKQKQKKKIAKNKQ